MRQREKRKQREKSRRKSVQVKREVVAGKKSSSAGSETFLPKPRENAGRRVRESLENEKEKETQRNEREKREYVQVKIKEERERVTQRNLPE